MINVVEIKFGKPILFLPYRMLRLIGLFAIVINVITIIYVFEMFNLALDIKHRVGDYIDLILENGYVLPLLVASCGLLNLPLNVFLLYTLYKAFNSVRKCISMLLFMGFVATLVMIVFYLIFAISALSHGYSSNPKYETSLFTALSNYSMDGLTKSKLDRLQVEFQCCGVRNYSDWYTVDWYDKNFIRKTEILVKGETPFSCCSINSIFPCIHHGAEYGAGAYHYTNENNFSLSVHGCFHVIETKKKRSAWRVVGYIMCLVLLMVAAAIPYRLIQTAHIERGKFDKENHIYTAWLIGCYTGKRRKFVDPPPVPPMPPELLE